MTPSQLDMFDPPVEFTISDEGLYRKLILRREDYYLPRMTAFDQRGAHASWNWAALFAPAIWLLYRKMYAGFWIYSGVSVVLGALAKWLLALPPLGAALLGGLLPVAFLIGFPILANGLYHQHLRRVMNNVRAAPSSEAANRIIDKKRGVNLVWPVVFGVISTVAMLFPLLPLIALLFVQV